MPSTARITFLTEELRPSPFPAFLPGFRDPAEREAASALVSWAIDSGLRFRHSRGKARLVEYIVVPNAVHPRGPLRAEPILTLQQANESRGSWDIPFGRMESLALGPAGAKQRLLDAFNAVLPPTRQLHPKGLVPGSDGRSWAQLPYSVLVALEIRDAFIQVLASAAEAARTGSTDGHF